MSDYKQGQVAIAYSKLPLGPTLTVAKEGCMLVYRVESAFDIDVFQLNKETQLAISVDEQSVYLLLNFGSLPWIKALCVWKAQPAAYIQNQLKLCVIDEKCYVLAARSETLSMAFMKTLAQYMAKAKNDGSGGDADLDALLATRKLTLRLPERD